MALNYFLAVYFEHDGIVAPKESAIFAELHTPETPGAERKLRHFADTDLYKEDWIGLRTLFESNRVYLRFIEDADHLKFTDQDIIREFIPFLFQAKHRKHSRFDRTNGKRELIL